MHKIDVSQLIQILANVGVLAGIVFLVIEVQQSNRLAIASTEMSVRNSFGSINESIYGDPSVAQLLAKTMDANTALTDAEAVRLGAFVRRALNAWLSIETAHANGMVPDDTHDLIEEDMRGLLVSFPAVSPIWKEVLDSYPALRSRQVLETAYRVHDELTQ